MIHTAHLRKRSLEWYRHYHQANDHVMKWLEPKIIVKRTDAPEEHSRYMATVGDYDLDCKAGYGPTPEEAIEDLKNVMED